MRSIFVISAETLHLRGYWRLWLFIK